MRNLFALILILATSQAVNAATIRENFLLLRKIFNPQGRSVSEATVSTQSDQPNAMVREYLTKRWNGDLKNYRFMWNSEHLMVNDASGGTIRAPFMQKVVNEWIYQKYHWGAEYDVAARQAEAVVNDLQKNGAAYGFDGGDHNACFFVTPLLLILDRTEHKVYAVEMSNCKP